MARIEARRPNASGQMMTAGCAPLVGCTNAASQVPSGVLMLTVVSVTATAAAAPEPAARTTPVTMDLATKSRRERSSELFSDEFVASMRALLCAGIVEY